MLNWKSLSLVLPSRAEFTPSVISNTSAGLGAMGLALGEMAPRGPYAFALSKCNAPCKCSSTALCCSRVNGCHDSHIETCSAMLKAGTTDSRKCGVVEDPHRWSGATLD
jgi:hypothetical protein